MAHRAPVVLLLLVVVALVVGAVLLLQGEAPDGGGGSGGAPGAAAVASEPAPVGALTGSGPEKPVREAAPAAAGDGRATLATPADGAAAQVRVRGRLVDEKGSGAAAIEVGLRLADAQLPAMLRGRALGSGEPDQRTQTGADGRFSFLLPAGKGATLSLLTRELVLRDTTVDELVVAAAQEDHDVGDLVVVPSSGVAGVVRDESGRPLEGVQVAVTGSGLFLPFGSRTRTTSGADGRFALAGLRAGTWQLVTASPAHLPLRQELQLGRSERRKDVVLELAEGGGLSGFVVDDLGRPIAGAEVAAERKRQLAPGMTFQGATPGESVRSDHNGMFVLGGIDADSVVVQATHEAHAPAGTEASKGSTNVVLEMKRLGAIEGRVVDGEGKPMAGSEIAVEGGLRGRGAMVLFRPRPVARTGDDGTFRLEGVEPGEVQLVATGDAHRPSAPHSVRVPPGDTVRGVRLSVETGAVLEVHVVDGSGAPVARADVRVTEVPAERPQDGARAPRMVTRSLRASGGGHGGAPGIPVRVGDSEVLGQGRTDDQGRARIAGLPAKAVQVRATHADLAPPVPLTLTLPASGTVPAELVMRRGGFVELTIVDVLGAPLSGVQWRVQPLPVGAGEDQRKDGETDDAGTARVGPLMPGAYTAVARAVSPPMTMGGMQITLAGGSGPELEDSRVRFEIGEGETAKVKLVRPVLTTLRGTVRDARGVVGDARVEMRPSSRVDGPPSLGAYSASSDRDGRFEIEGLPPGDYQLRYGRQDAMVLAEEPLEVRAAETEIVRHLMLTGGVLQLMVVADASGKPVADAKVTLERQGGPGGTVSEQVQVGFVVAGPGAGPRPGGFRMNMGQGEIVTDAEGKAVVRDVPPGKYTVVIQHEDHARTRVRDVEVAAEATKDLGVVKLGAGGAIRGRVVDADGKPAPMALVRMDGGSGRETRPAMGGEFEFSGLDAGKYVLRAQRIGTDAPAVDGPEREVVLRRGATESVELRLPR